MKNKTVNPFIYLMKFSADKVGISVVIFTVTFWKGKKLLILF